MTGAERDYVVECLVQEIELRTPGASTSSAANRALAREFIEEHCERVEAAVARARQPDGDLSPWIIERELLVAFEEHCRSRIKPATWNDGN
jgi:hypothetical protein